MTLKISDIYHKFNIIINLFIDVLVSKSVDISTL